MTDSNNVTGQCRVPSRNMLSTTVTGSPIRPRPLPAFPKKAEAVRMEAALRARAGVSADAKIIWSFDFKDKKWKPEICDRDCQDPKLQAQLLKNTPSHQPGLLARAKTFFNLKQNSKRFAKAAAFSFAWPITVPGVIWGACPGSPGDNTNDSGVDASNIPEAGQPDADADVVVPRDPFCIPADQRQGIEDKVVRLLDGNGDECKVVDMASYTYPDGNFSNAGKDFIYVLCANSSNSIQLFNPRTKELTQISGTEDIAPTADEIGGQGSGDVHVLRIHPFTVQTDVGGGTMENRTVIAVTAQLKGNPNVENTRSFVYFLSDDGLGAPESVRRMQRIDVAVQVQMESEWVALNKQYPVAVHNVGNKLWVAPLDGDEGNAANGDFMSGYRPSGFLGYNIADQGNDVFTLGGSPSIARAGSTDPDDPFESSMRPYAIQPVHEDMFVGVFGGHASATIEEQRKPKVAFFDSRLDLALHGAAKVVTTETHSWQYSVTRGIGISPNKRNYVVVSQETNAQTPNPITDAKSVVVVNVDDPYNIENAQSTSDSADLPLTVDNPDAAETAVTEVATGAPVNITMHEDTAVIWMRGDGLHYGFAVLYDVASSGGALSSCRYVPLGSDVGPAVYLESTGRHYWANNAGTNCAPSENWMGSMDPDTATTTQCP